MAVGLFLV